MTDNKGAYKSPGHLHGFNFIFEGDIRYGPSYYKIELDGELIEDRLFGFEFKWHPESKYLALQEWLTTDYSMGPNTALTLIELERKQFAQIATASHGFIRALKFEGDVIVFEKEFLAKGITTKHEIKLSEITNWKPWIF